MAEDRGPRIRPYGIAWWGWVLGINLAWPLALSALIRLGPLADSAYRPAAVLTCVLILFTANQVMGRLIGGAGVIWVLSGLNLAAYLAVGSIAFLPALPELPGAVTTLMQ
ncbi:hypothetical protein [Sagittula sp. S175]|uniref:hypothetical protein n=1 Tax=Sagittula sp. S175 TaxID=3415129 RepID=UPI003C7ED905